MALILLLLSVQEDPFRDFWKPVDLELKGASAREALEALSRRSGVPIMLPKAEGKPIDLQLRGATFWQAFDGICRAHGGVRIPIARGGRGALFEEESWIEFPAFYRGPFRVHVQDVGRVRELVYPQRRDRTDLGLVLSWTPGFEPLIDELWKAGEMRITKALDDAGTSLLPELDGPHEYDFSIAGAFGEKSCGWLFRLQAASERATRIASLEGEWSGGFLGEVEALRFPRPAEAVGKTLKAGPVLVTLTRFERPRDPLAWEGSPHYQVALKLGVDPAAPPEWRAGLKSLPLARRLLREGELEGGPRSGLLTFHALDGKDPEAPEFHGHVWSADDAPLALTLRVAKAAGTGRFAFSFRDVGMPGR